MSISVGRPIITLPLQRPASFQPPADADPGQREQLLEARQSYREVDNALAEIREKMARVAKLDGTSSDADPAAGGVDATETHFIGFHKMQVYSQLQSDPSTGAPVKFSQSLESGDRWSYRNEGGVERFESSPTSAGTSYMIDHNNGTITIDRPSFDTSSYPASYGGGGGAWSHLVDKGRQRAQEDRETLESAAEGFLVGAVLGAGMAVGLRAL